MRNIALLTPYLRSTNFVMADYFNSAGLNVQAIAEMETRLVGFRQYVANGMGQVALRGLLHDEGTAA